MAAGVFPARQAKMERIRSFHFRLAGVSTRSGVLILGGVGSKGRGVEVGCLLMESSADFVLASPLPFLLKGKRIPPSMSI